MRIWVVNNHGWIEVFDSEEKAWDYIFQSLLNHDDLTAEDLEDAESVKYDVLHHGFDISIFSTILK